MQTSNKAMRLVMDWRAAVIAGLLAGGLTLLLRMILWSTVTGGSPWTPFHHSASILLGQGVFAPTSPPDLGVLAVGLLVHMGLSLFYTIVLAFIIHRWGLVVGILGGALFGLAVYAINYYSLTLFFPWYSPLRSWLVLAFHVFFGATAGGLYEGLERDIYVLDDPPAAEPPIV